MTTLNLISITENDKNLIKQTLDNFTFEATESCIYIAFKEALKLENETAKRFKNSVSEVIGKLFKNANPSGLYHWHHNFNIGYAIPYFIFDNDFHGILITIPDLKNRKEEIYAVLNSFVKIFADDGILSQPKVKEYENIFSKELGMQITLARLAAQKFKTFFENGSISSANINHLQTNVGFYDKTAGEIIKSIKVSK